MKQDFRTLNELLANARQQFGSRTYLAAKRDGRYQPVTYEAFGAQVDAARAGLVQLGVKRGDRVAVISDNCVPWAVMAFATFGLGALYVPMYEAQLPGEWSFILGDCEASLVLAGSPAVAARLAPYLKDLPAVRQVVVLRPGSEALPAGQLGFEQLLERGRAAPVPQETVEPTELATLTYTSGTTGKPKGVMLTHYNIASNVSAVMDAFGMDPQGERSLAFLPWAHVYGQVVELYAALAGGSQIYLAESPTTLLQNLGEAQPTVLFSVPRVWNKVYAGIHGKMLQEGGAKLALFRRALAVAQAREELAKQGKRSALLDVQGRVLDKLVFSKIRARLGGRLKYAVSGAASLSPEVARFFSHVGLTVCEGYGLTETSPVATNNRPGQIRLGSVGKALPGVSVRIEPVEGIPAGQGEVVVKGPNVMQGYYRRPEETAAVLLPDGSFRTGDLGRMDADGYVYITGRVKEQFKLENGKYVSPAPLEEALKVSPYIAQVFLEGANRPHVVALVVPNAEALLAWAKNNGLEGKTIPQLIGEPAVRGFYRAELDRLSTGFKGFERVVEFSLVPEEFTADNGLLTPSLKVKRAAVAQRFRGQLDALYAEPAAA